MENENYSKGINQDHALLFITGDYMGYNPGDWNKWTGHGSMTPQTPEKPYAGIVQKNLQGGYPVLNPQVVNTDDSTLPSMQGRDGGESLAYLFDPKMESQGKASFSDVKGLLQVDKDGYYYYNSQQNYAVFYEADNAFTLYDYPGVIPGGTSPVGQFFPFNQATQQPADGFMNGVTSKDPSINHYFGMHMSTRFIQQFGGHVSAADDAEAVTYEFSGDDDVWIFIDDILVADLGGIHDMASVTINFANGTVVINEGKRSAQTLHLKALMDLSGTTFADNTYHTLDLFYLERGNTDSNLYLRYNLVTIPESSVIKVDQVGDPVLGAEFKLYAASDLANAIATGVTNNNGEFVFKDEEGFPITIADLYKKYGQDKGNQLILKETKTPKGYRTNGDIYLYFQKTANGEVLLLSDSIWDKGAYAMSKVTATINGRSIGLLALATGNEVIETKELNPADRPLMFAVVYQKQDNGTWLPVYGDPLNGWKVVENSTWDSVLVAARENPYIFELTSSGAYQVEVSNLPGDIRTYYYVCEKKDKNNAKYTVAYYYTDAQSLSGATAENTWRISSDNDELKRVFSVNLYVSNIKNRLLVQKVNEEGEVITDAGFEFTLYSSNQVTVNNDGTVTIKDKNTYYDRLTTTEKTSIPNFTGGGIFPTAGKVLANGEYYLVETSAPYGYKKSEKATHIVVDNTGVYADAGKADDGIEVLRGVGSIMRSMLQFATDDDVDTTLHDIKATLASGVTYQDGTIKWKKNDETIWDEASNQVLHLQFEKGNALLDYGAFENQPRALVTDVGWSKLLVRQCKTHTGTNTGVKQDLKNQDITNLFSGTVTVRVTNERVGNLTISKEVEVISGSPDLENQSFTFSIYNQKGGTPISGTYDAIDKEENMQTVNFDEEGNTTVVLKKGESLTILGLPYDSYYKVEEKLITGYNVSIVKNNGDKVESAIIEGSIPHSTSEDLADTLAFTNSYDGATRVQLSGSKIMEGRDLTTNDKFTFSLGVYDTQTQTAVGNNKIELPENLEKSVTAVGNTNRAEFIFDFITFHEAGIFTFEINEIRSENATAATNYVYDGIKYDPSTILAVVTVTLDNDTNKLVTDVEYFLKGDNDERIELEKMTFTNTGAYDLTVAKQVTGEMGDRDKQFTFQIQLKKSNSSILTGEYDYTGGTVAEITGVVAPNNSTLNLDSEGKATFTLSTARPSPSTAFRWAQYTPSPNPMPRQMAHTVSASGSGTQLKRDASCSGSLDRATTVTFTNEKGTAVPTRDSVRRAALAAGAAVRPGGMYGAVCDRQNTKTKGRMRQNPWMSKIPKLSRPIQAARQKKPGRGGKSRPSRTSSPFSSSWRCWRSWAGCSSAWSSAWL